MVFIREYFVLKFLKHRSLYAVNMTFTDGYIARHYTKKQQNPCFEILKGFAQKLLILEFQHLF